MGLSLLSPCYFQMHNSTGKKQVSTISDSTCICLSRWYVHHELGLARYKTWCFNITWILVQIVIRLDVLTQV
jgi:hypothetical protein